MKQRQVIFFDFDGVIADSLSIAFEVSKMSRPNLTIQKYKSYFDGNINDAKYDEKVVREVNFFKEYGERLETLRIDEQKKNVIEKLAQEFQLFIVSSSSDQIIRSYLQRYDILSCFTEILGNETHQSKVEKFRMLFQKYNFAPKDAIFITDSSGDMKEAKIAGVQTIVGILGGYQEEEKLKKENPAVIVQNFSQFYDFMQKMI